MLPTPKQFARPCSGRACGSSDQDAGAAGLPDAHRTRHLFIRQQTAVINAIRAHLAEFGIVAPVGRNGVEQLLDVVADQRTSAFPRLRARALSTGCAARKAQSQILEFDRQINAWHRSNETSRRLDDLPGVGPALATALVASVADPKAFRSGRDFSAWVGLVPKQNSAEARRSSATSPSRVIDICARYSAPVHWP